MTTEGQTGQIRGGIPLRALAPSVITMLALCVGLTGARFAMVGAWEKAVMAIVIAGVLDGMDGRVARLMRGTTRFGAELDSLSDIVAFGVAPAIVVYFWSLHHLGGFGWIICLSLTVCCALRLARFNAELPTETPAKAETAPITAATAGRNIFQKAPLPRGFFRGVPSPAAAGLALSPIFFELWLGGAMFSHPIVTAGIVLLVAALMVSTVPTYSGKGARIAAEHRLPLLLGAGLFAGALFTTPWATLSLLSLAYAASIPFSARAARRLQAAQNVGASAGMALEPVHGSLNEEASDRPRPDGLYASQSDTLPMQPLSAEETRLPESPPAEKPLPDRAP